MSVEIEVLEDPARVVRPDRPQAQRGPGLQDDVAFLVRRIGSRTLGGCRFGRHGRKFLHEITIAATVDDPARAAACDIRAEDSIGR